MRIKLFLLLITQITLADAKAEYCGDMTFDEKTNEASLIFSGRLIFFTDNNGIPDSLLLVATDVWKGRYFPGDTIFIYNNLNGGGIFNVEEDEEYLIYSKSNIIMPCAGSRPVWSTTETDKLDYKFKRQHIVPYVLLNGVRFTKREAERVESIFHLADLSIPDSLKPMDPVIQFGERKISLKTLSELNFDEPVELLLRRQGNKDQFILQYQNTEKKKKFIFLFKRKTVKNNTE